MLRTSQVKTAQLHDEKGPGSDARSDFVGELLAESGLVVM
jgi:hypothetical protein